MPLSALWCCCSTGPKKAAYRMKFRLHLLLRYCTPPSSDGPLTGQSVELEDLVTNRTICSARGEKTKHTFSNELRFQPGKTRQLKQMSYSQGDKVMTILLTLNHMKAEYGNRTPYCPHTRPCMTLLKWWFVQPKQINCPSSL